MAETQNLPFESHDANTSSQEAKRVREGKLKTVIDDKSSQSTKIKTVFFV